jgi:transposase-like protein
MDTQDKQSGKSLNGLVKSSEVLEKPMRRQFDAAYKLRILAEAERLQASGEVGALLRREGLYSSHLATWRKQRAAGGESGLSSKKRGRKPLANAAERAELERLRRENARLKHRLQQAETIIEFQKKVAELLDRPSEPLEPGRPS